MWYNQFRHTLYYLALSVSDTLSSSGFIVHLPSFLCPLISIPHMYTDFYFTAVPLSCPTLQSLPLSVQCLCNYVPNVTKLFGVAAPFFWN